MIAKAPFPWADYSGGVNWCRCCGESIWPHKGRREDGRCWRHKGRNPCAIDGCKRSRKAPESGELSLDDYLCGEHWRAFVPPGSAERRIYNRFFRRARKFGWTPKSCEAFWRFWRRLIARARDRAAGDIDEAEIRKLFGWVDAA